jgi:hypothetical protein
MKIIKSKSYQRKQAIWSQMPIGDPNLPGQLTEQDIGGPEADISSGIEGESEIDQGKIYYTYDYDYDNNIATNIQPTKLMSPYYGLVEDPNELGTLIENNESLIKNDIEHSQEDPKIERQPGYGEQEYDPNDQFEAMGF